MQGTEPSPDFHAQVAELVRDRAAGCVLYCSQGGAIDGKEEGGGAASAGGEGGAGRRGRQSRSLIAAYELTREGYSNLLVLRGGYQGWEAAGRDVEVFQTIEEEEGDEEGGGEAAA